MNEEIKKIINQIEDRLALHEVIKEPISGDLDKAIKLSVAYENLLKENQQLKDIINKAKEYTKKHTIGNTYGKSHYFDDFDIFTRPSSLLEILDGKGYDK